MWNLNNIRIITQEFGETKRQTIARLQPLAGGTVMQTFGYESPTYQLTGKVVGLSNLNALKGLLNTGVKYTLTTDIDTKSVYVADLQAKRDYCVSQTIDPAEDCDAPVWSITLNLYE